MDDYWFLVSVIRRSDIMTARMDQKNPLYFALPALIIDVAALVASLFILPSLAQKLQTPGGTNALLVSGVFLLFICGVFVMRRMEPAPNGTAEWMTRGRRAALSLFFALVISLGLAWQLGFFQTVFEVETTQMGEGESSSYFVYAPGAWLAFSLAYVLVFAFQVDQKIDAESRGYLPAALFGLATADAILLVMAAQGRAILPPGGYVWIWAALAFLTLLLLFLPPRLLYLSRTAGLRSPAAYSAIASLLVLVGFLTWQIVAPVLRG